MRPPGSVLRSPFRRAQPSLPGSSLPGNRESYNTRFILPSTKTRALLPGRALPTR